MSAGPTAASEFRRGLNAYNLMVGALAALAAGVAARLAAAGGVLPDVLGAGATVQALALALGLFAVITGMHTATHTYFGWRFARGIRAAEAGRHQRARRLLAPVERRGMSHYDEGGHARRVLAILRHGGPDTAPKPPTLGTAPAEPSRSSITGARRPAPPASG